MNRAKRVKIDPVQWNPTHLKGARLLSQTDSKAPLRAEVTQTTLTPVSPPVEAEDSSSDESSDNVSPELSQQEIVTLKESLDEEALTQEREAQLALINSMMGSTNGRPQSQDEPVSQVAESEDSSLDDEVMPTENSIETIPAPANVPQVLPTLASKKRKLPVIFADEESAPVWTAVQRFVPTEAVEDSDETEDGDDETTQHANEGLQAASTVKIQSLKDMFKPQEAEGQKIIMLSQNHAHVEY